MPALQKRDGRLRREQRVDRAGERDVALAVRQAAAREVHATQRRRACRVDRQARPAQVQRSTRVGWRRCSSRCPRSVDVDQLAARPDAMQHRRSRARRCRRTRPAAVPASRCGGCRPSSSASQHDLEQEPLLRVHPPRLARRDAEEVGVEAVDLVDEAAAAHVDPTGPRRVRVVERRDLGAVRRDLARRVGAHREQLPEALRAVCAAREAAAHADDRDRARHVWLADQRGGRASTTPRSPLSVSSERGVVGSVRCPSPAARSDHA